jgi:hypothetical protein
MRTKSAKPKKSPLDGYKTYNPEVEGYGDSYEWRQAFKFRMGIDKARSTVGSKSPRGILGLAESVMDWSVIQKAYRKLAIEYFPEERDGKFRGDKDKFLAVQAAYEVLEAEFKK